MTTVTAIICVHNGEAFIAEALESIRCQTRQVDAVLVVDDGSTDDTCGIVKRTMPGAVLIRTAQCGLANARNLGVSSCATDLLAFLDADDLWPEQRTAALLDTLAAHSDAGMVCGRIRIEEIRPNTADERLRQADGKHIPFMVQSGLIRRSLWQNLGGMNSVHDRAEDVDLFLRIVEAGTRIAYADAETLIYRVHGANRSRDVDLSQMALFGTLRATLLRRRANADRAE